MGNSKKEIPKSKKIRANVNLERFQPFFKIRNFKFNNEIDLSYVYLRLTRVLEETRLHAMKKGNIFDADYKNWLVELKGKIRSVQVKAAIAVNSALIGFYWDLGKMITEKQTNWGSQFLENLSKDLQAEFPDMQGLSLRNLKYTRQFYQFYSSAFPQQTVDEFGQQVVAQIGKQPVRSIGQQVVAELPWGITY